MDKKDIRSLSLDELKIEMESIGEKAFRAKQVYEWLHTKLADSFDEMTNLSKDLREKLDGAYRIPSVKMLERQVSNQDGTNKFLFQLEDGNVVESVLMRYKHGNSVCISSQVGCRMGCKFCASTIGGKVRDLAPSEMLGQIYKIQKLSKERVHNVVVMGTGEPLDNYDNVMRAIEILTADWGFAWSPKRITLSTIGVLPTLKRYLDECRCHLAVSLHNPFADERLSVMPAQKAWPVQEVIDLIRKYDFTGQRRVSFEYTMFAGFNDTKAHADALIRMLRGLECRMNLIRFHKIPDFPYETSPDVIMENFKTRLNNSGIMTTIRASRGEDILAACGMLAGEHRDKNI